MIQIGLLFGPGQLGQDAAQMDQQVDAGTDG
jgi:hypothetical protein